MKTRERMIVERYGQPVVAANEQLAKVNDVVRRELSQNGDFNRELFSKTREEIRRVGRELDDELDFLPSVASGSPVDAQKMVALALISEANVQLAAVVKSDCNATEKDAQVRSLIERFSRRLRLAIDTASELNSDWDTPAVDIDVVGEGGAGS